MSLSQVNHLVFAHLRPCSHFEDELVQERSCEHDVILAYWTGLPSHQISVQVSICEIHCNKGFSEERWTSSQYDSTFGSIWSVGQLVCGIPLTPSKVNGLTNCVFRQQKGVELYIRPLLGLHCFDHCMYTNVEELPLSPLQVIPSTLSKSPSLKTEGDCIGWHLIINTNYHPIRR